MSNGSVECQPQCLLQDTLVNLRTCSEWPTLVSAECACSASSESDAVTFDGTVYLSRDLGLDGVVTSGVGVLSVWLKPAAFTGEQQLWSDYVAQGGSGSDVAITTAGSDQNPANTLRLSWDDAVNGIGGSGLNSGVNSTVDSIVPATWINVLTTWDTTITDPGPVAQLYVNDVAVAVDAGTSADPFQVAYSSIMGWALGAEVTANGPPDLFYIGDMYDFYFAPGQTLDLSVTANRRKFITAGKKPVSLGPTGTGPTGTRPAVFFHGNASSFGTNRGSGGAFTRHGAFHTAHNNP